MFCCYAPPVFLLSCNEYAHSDESPKPVRVMPFCVVIHDNIYKIAIKMDYLNRIRSHVKVKSINYYATYRKIYRRYFSKFNTG